MIDEDLSTVTNHLRDLYDAGCIEFVEHRGEGNLRKAVYRAIARPFMSREEAKNMSPKERQEVAGVYLQWLLAEAVAAYQTEKMASDDTCVVVSDDPCLDAKGRLEMDDFLTACWTGENPDLLIKLKSVQHIAARAMSRMAESKEKGTMVVASLMTFERARLSISEGSSRVPISKP